MVGALAAARPPPPAPDPPMALAIAVDPSNVTDHVSDHMYGTGIDTYEHQIYGGFWSNMIFVDSVEDASKGPLTADAIHSSWFSAGGGACSVQAGGMNGNQSLLLEGKGSTAINRGLVVAGNETSMHFVGEQPYEGYVCKYKQSPPQLDFQGFV